MNSMTTKIFAIVALCIALGSQAFSFHVRDDKLARRAAVKARCETSIANNERVKTVAAACAADDVVQHYEYVDNLLLLAFTLAALGACVGFLFPQHKRQPA